MNQYLLVRVTFGMPVMAVFSLQMNGSDSYPCLISLRRASSSSKHEQIVRFCVQVKMDAMTLSGRSGSCESASVAPLGSWSLG